MTEWNFMRQQKKYKRGERPKHRRATGAFDYELQASLAKITMGKPKRKAVKK